MSNANEFYKVGCTDDGKLFGMGQCTSFSFVYSIKTTWRTQYFLYFFYLFPGKCSTSSCDDCKLMFEDSFDTDGTCLVCAIHVSRIGVCCWWLCFRAFVLISYGLNFSHLNPDCAFWTRWNWRQAHFFRYLREAIGTSLQDRYVGIWDFWMGDILNALVEH